MAQNHKSNIFQLTYNEIRKSVIFGEFSQGEKLIESDLMHKYAATRYVLREVIKKLAGKGYVEVVPNRGATVRKISLQENEEIFNILILLEGKAAELAASERKDSDVDKLYELWKDTQENTAEHNFMGWIEGNDKIHLYISSLCSSKILPELIRDLRDRINRHNFLLSIGNYLVEYNEAHKKIIDSIADKLPHEASEYMKLHLETAKQNRMKFVKNFSGGKI